jgi:hypothetical protein
MHASFFITGLLVVGAGAIIYGTTMLERLVRFQYKHHRDNWRLDGGPRVSFWAPEESASYSAGKRFARRLLFVTPGWLASEPMCRAWLTAFRFSTVVWFVVVLTIFGYLISL